jgi:hypothetical protein
MTRLLLETSTTNATPWAAALLGVITLIYITVVRPMRKAKKTDPLRKPLGQVGLAQQRSIERDLSNLLVEYEEMIRRMTAQVDTRSTKLELLIQQADERLAQLKAAMAEVSAAAMTEPQGKSTPKAITGKPANAKVDSLPSLAIHTQAELFPRDEAGVPIGTPDARYAEIYTLADKGRSARQIARQLNRPHGEIELILALREPRASK